MSREPFNFAKMLRGLNRGAPRPDEQLYCQHYLSSRMEDGKYFCPLCGLTDNKPLRSTGGK